MTKKPGNSPWFLFLYRQKKRVFILFVEEKWEGGWKIMVEKEVFTVSDEKKGKEEKEWNKERTEKLLEKLEAFLMNLPKTEEQEEVTEVPVPPETEVEEVEQKEKDNPLIKLLSKIW